MEIKLHGNIFVSAEAPFIHYDTFHFWITRDISQKTSQNILDMGGKTLINGWLRILNEVIAVN